MILTKALRSSYHRSIHTTPLSHNLIYIRAVSFSPEPAVNPNSLNSNYRNESTARLSQLFTEKTERRLRSESGIVYKELSPSVIEFCKYLYEQGYFSTDASLFSNGKFDAACFRYIYARNFLRHAVEKFGCKNQEIAKWLSGSDLKKVALFGCPSLSRRTVFSAKTLRSFFKIQENTVCSKCVLKQSCKYANQNVWNGNTKNLYMPAVMNVMSHYALESVHPQLRVPDEIKTIVTRLLKVVVKLSQTVS